MLNLTKRLEALEKIRHSGKVFILYPIEEGMSAKDIECVKQKAWNQYLSEGGNPDVGQIYQIGMHYSHQVCSWYYAS